MVSIHGPSRGPGEDHVGNRHPHPQDAEDQEGLGDRAGESEAQGGPHEGRRAGSRDDGGQYARGQGLPITRRSAGLAAQARQDRPHLEDPHEVQADGEEEGPHGRHEHWGLELKAPTQPGATRPKYDEGSGKSQEGKDHTQPEDEALVSDGGPILSSLPHSAQDLQGEDREDTRHEVQENPAEEGEHQGQHQGEAPLGGLGPASPRAASVPL